MALRDGRLKKLSRDGVAGKVEGGCCGRCVRVLGRTWGRELRRRERRVWPEGHVLDCAVEEFAWSPGPEELLKDF